MTKVTKQVKGEWLRIALKAMGVRVIEAALTIGLSEARRLHQHMSDKSHLGCEHLAALARVYPQLNIRYVLTGEGSPLL